LAAAALLAAVPAWAAPPLFEFEAQAVVVSGLEPGSRVALLGISRGFNGFTSYVLRYDEVLTMGAEGSARLELELPVSLDSVWAAVDLATGEVGLGAPEGSAIREVSFSGSAIDADGRSVTEARRWVDLLWVQPGAGAGGVWGARLRDGGPSDEDGIEDLSIRAPMSAFAPTVAGSAEAPEAPERLASGDVLVAIDPETLEISATRLPESEPPSTDLSGSE
jgi:hypothetical protein